MNITIKDRQLLEYLQANANRLVTRAELLREIWQAPENLKTRTVDMHIARIRKHSNAPIRTIYAGGYIYEQPQTEDATP